MSAEQQFQKNEVKFHPCLSAQCLELEGVIENEATYADDTLGLGTAFLIIKDIRANKLDISNPVALVAGFFQSLGEPLSCYLSSGYLTPNWERLNHDQSSKVIVKLLTQGAMVEPPVFDNIEPARLFTQKLFQCFGEPCYFFTNVKWRTKEPHQEAADEPVISKASGFCVFKVGDCTDEGVVLISPTRVGALWFLGYD
jgi:hypothetical protein